VITLRSARLVRGSRILLDNSSVILPPRARVGVVGANGAGKSSLFAALAGELELDRGELEIPAGWVIARVEQETPASSVAAIEYVLDGDPVLRAAQAEIDAADASGDGERVALAHERLDHAGGYTARARAAELITGLGFAAGEIDRPVSEFSGGWRMRLNLARALIRRSDLLLLDEPTNHLDLEAIVWLEQWLAAYEGTLLVISHDREFLDAAVGAVLAFENARLVFHSGNFSSYEAASAARLAREQSLATRQQKEVTRLRTFIERFRAKATKARQAQSRAKALERMELIAPAHVNDAIRFEFRDPGTVPDPALVIEDASAGYGDAPVLEQLNLTIAAGARIGLIGPNGAGKSTLIKLLAGVLAPSQGERRPARNLSIGYFAQHQQEQLRPDEGALQHLARIAPQAREQELRDYLGQFNFGGERVAQPVVSLSGGEQARLLLALIIWQRPNLVLLDEPTNHLDMETREALTLALQEYEGAVVLVSHDRHLLRTTADELLVISQGRASRYDGDLDDYRASVIAARKPSVTAEAPSRRDERRLAAQARQRESASRKPLQTRIARAEIELARLGAERMRLENLMASSELYAADRKGQLAAAIQDAAQVKTAIEELEREWLECHAALDALAAEKL
jgi:ATP-binding cassette subfamily F protein 3